MENSEEILQILERFTEQKAQQIPKQLDTYLEYVARTGDSVFKWTNIKYLMREKLMHAIKNFNTNIAQVEEVPNYPNVDPFNYEAMESMLLERFELFNAAPFTIQRLCELLVEPRKHYTRIDKYMRALEKNILVVSTVEPGRIHENSNGDPFDTLDDVDIELDEQEERTVIAIATKILAENKITQAFEKEVEFSPKRCDKLSTDDGGNDQDNNDDELEQPERKKPKLVKEDTLDEDEERDPNDGDISDKNETLGEETSKQIADDATEQKQSQQDEVEQSIDEIGKSLDEIGQSKEDQDDKEFDENNVAVPSDITNENQKIDSVESETKAQVVENDQISIESQVTDKEESGTDNELTQNADQTEDSTFTELLNEKQAEVGDATEDVEKDEQEEEEVVTSGGRTITYTTEIDTPEASALVITHHVAIEIESSSQTETNQKPKEENDLEITTPEMPVQADANEMSSVLDTIEEQPEQPEQGCSLQKTEDMEAEEITTEPKSDTIEDITSATTDSEMITDSNEAKPIDNMDIDGDNSQQETMDVL